MIQYITSDGVLGKLPASFDVDTCEAVIKFLIDGTVAVNCQYSITPTDIADRSILEIATNQFVDDFTVEIADAVESVSFEVVVAKPDISKVAWWLKLQQLDYIVPILAKLDYGKLKQAALIARKLSTMQGTEYALRTMLSLLDATDTVQLSRKWKLGESVAYDDIHSTELYKRDYKPTGEAMLQYYAGKLDTWSKVVRSKASQLVIGLDDLATCISNVLPATLRLTDWQRIQLALSIVYAYTAALHTEKQHASTSIDAVITVDSSATFSKHSIVRTIADKVLLRHADADEPCCYTGLVAMLNVSSNVDIVVDVSIDDIPFATDLQLGHAKLCILQSDNIKPGKHTITFCWQSEACTNHSYSTTIELKPDSSAVCIAELSNVESLEDIKPELVNAVGTIRLVKQYTDALHKTFARQSTAMPKSYAQFYLQYSRLSTAYKLAIVSPAGIKMHDLTLQSLVSMEDFSASFTTINGAQIVVLTSRQYMSIYTVDMFLVQATMTDRNDKYVRLRKQSVYLAGNVQPFATYELFRRYLYNKVHSMYRAVYISNLVVNGQKLGASYYANDLRTDNTTTSLLLAGHKQLATDLHNAGFVVNMHEQLIGTISTTDDKLVMQFNPMSLIDNGAISSYETVTAVYTRRHASFYLHPAKHLKTDIPYVVIAIGCVIKLYYIEGDNGFMVHGDNDSLVFSMMHSGHYQLEVQSDYYYKLIDIQL